jgi:hypothetical protein
MGALTRWLGCLWVVGALACRGDPGPGDGGVLPPSSVEICRRLAGAHCGYLARCHPAFYRATDVDCRANLESQCYADFGAIRPALEADRLSVEAGAASACQAEMAAAECGATFPPGYPPFVTSPFPHCTLAGLVRGKVAAGQPCELPVECAQGTVCVKPGGVCKGTCSSLGQPGEPCGFGCAAGLYCETQGTQATIDDGCAPGKAQDAPCGTSRECQAHLWCAGTCQPLGGIGAPCKDDPDRLTTCDQGAACDLMPFTGSVGQCVARAGLGGSCQYHWTCQPELVCHGLDLAQFPFAPPPQPGSCGPPSAQGTTCGYTRYAFYVGDSCASSLTCLSEGTCGTRPSLGEPCDPATQACAGLEVYCKPAGTSGEGQCTGPANEGDRCAFPLDATRVVQIPCKRGYCDADGSQTCKPADKALGQECTSNAECLSGRCTVQEDQSLRCAQACG